jgi:diguanylate cyclase (GGDEF)-like protein/PAS domain S-box-containing protein
MDNPDNSLHKALWHAYFDHANDGVFVLSEQLQFLDLNQRLLSWMGLDTAAENGLASSLQLTDLVGSGRNLRVFREHLMLAQIGQPVRFECHIQPRRGTARWVEVSLSPVTAGALPVIIGMARDATERRQLIAALEQQSNFDDLTGLCNRRNFTRHLERLLHGARNGEHAHALVYIDLDHFKIINDTCGHSAGDQFLSQLAGALQNKVRRSDVIARIGGDEFGVLLEDCAVERAMLVAESLRSTVTELPFCWEGKVFHSTASIGITEITKQANAALILSYADAACYVAKDNGRNNVQLFFGGDKCTRKRTEMDWVARINEAFENDRFRLFYQNIVPVLPSDVRHEHCEVLLRMVDAQGNLIPPMEFIPAAEKYDLMQLIDRWVIRTLFATKSSEWQHFRNDCARRPGMCSLQYSVNLSGASICNTQFLDFLLEEIARHAIPPNLVCLEITETMAISNMDKARQFIKQARSAGCRIALDDFGSGMSSFAYLKHLPIDYLKIDGSLIRNIAEDPSDFGIVDAVNRIGHLLGFKTVAEFVENDAIMTKLRQIGIDYAQGYGVHKPEALRNDIPARLLASSS